MDDNNNNWMIDFLSATVQATEIAEKIYPELKLDKVEWEICKQNFGGYAFYKKNLIRISAPMCQQFSKNEILKTCLHEIAHIINHKLATLRDGKVWNSHGYQFHRICQQLGLDYEGTKSATDTSRCEKRTGVI